MYQRIFDYYFRLMRLGILTIALPDGRFLRYGLGEEGVEAQITVKNNDFFKKCVLFGDVGFGESFVDGDWKSGNLTKVIEWMCLNVENHPTMMDQKENKNKVNWLKILNNILKHFQKNTVDGSRKNISSHYDLSNEFFSVFLDKTMTYSSAYFKAPEMSMENAQTQKYDELCRKLQIKETDSVLEIGSGWGGFALHAARNYGCSVTAITISKEQYAFAKQRFKDEGLDHKIDIRLVDYRQVTGVYDKIVSIEMIEAVGPQYYEAFFAQCHRLLKKDGLLGLQAIMSPDCRYESFLKNMDWIQKHIFPGSLLPSLSALMRAANKTGTLGLHDFEDITGHYGKTLMMWREKFMKNVEKCYQLGFDDRFIRKWDYYLCYCAGAFNMRNISTAQLIFTRPNNTKLGTSY